MIDLDPHTIQDVLLEQLKEANENRYYLMSIIRQQEKNFRAEIARLESEYEEKLLKAMIDTQVQKSHLMDSTERDSVLATLASDEPSEDYQ